MKNNIYNPVESSIMFIRSRVPEIILSFNNALRKTLPEILESSINQIKNDTKSLINLIQIAKQYKPSIDVDLNNPNLDFLNVIDPINFVDIVNNKTYIETFLNEYKENETVNGLKCNGNEFTNFQDDLFVNRMRLPLLEMIDLSEMSSIGLQFYNIDFIPIPKMGVKTVENYKIFEFMNVNYDSSTNSRVSETLVGQIDYKTLATGLLAVYAKALNNVQSPELDKVLINIINYDKNGNLYLKDNYQAFIIFNKIMNIESKIANFKYETNLDSLNNTEVKNDIIEALKNSFNKELDMYIKRCVMSMIFTYLIKVGREDLEVGNYDIHKDMLNGLLDVTLEDIDYFNNKFENKHLDEDSETYKFLNPLNRKKTGTIFRKRLLDYMMLSFLSNKQSKVNFSGYNFFTRINDTTVDDSLYIKLSNTDKIDNTDSTYKHGSKIFRFVLRNMNEIYSNMTYTTNSDKVIIKINGNKIQTNDAKTIIEKVINNQIINHELKLFINSTVSEVNNHYNTSNLYLYESNNYTFNTIKNHRALASVYKAAVHVVFKLLYALDSIKKYAEFTKTMKVPPEHAERLITIKTQVKDIFKILSDFKTPCYCKIFKDAFPENGSNINQTYIDTIEKIAPSSVYSLALLLGGDLVNVSILDSELNGHEYTNGLPDFTIVALKKSAILLKKYTECNNDSGMIEKDFSNLAPIYINAGDYDDEIFKEFDFDSDIVKTLENIGDLNDPDLKGTHRSLYTSYEEMQKEFFNPEQMQDIYDISDINKTIDKSIEFVKQCNSIEDLAFISSGISLYEKHFLNYKDPNEQEKNASVIKKIEDFDRTLESKCRYLIDEWFENN